jgi:SAM-dependent methyltransferase
MKKPLPGTLDSDLHEGYVDTAPSNQSAVDTVPGWSSSFPSEYSVLAGNTPLFADGRISIFASRMGSLEGMRILELGPLDGAHSYMLEQYGAEVVAIEGNKRAFLRCLITKEIYGLKRTRFKLGNFDRALEDMTERFDAVVACGVLYHSNDPVKLIEAISRITDTVLIWTHVIDRSVMDGQSIHWLPFSGNVVKRTLGSTTIHMYERAYSKTASVQFCGGPRPRHYWMERHEALALLRAVGFASVEVVEDQPDHPNGPAVTILCRRHSATGPVET